MRASVIQLAEKSPVKIKTEKEDTTEDTDSQPLDFSFEKCQSDDEEDCFSVNDELLKHSPLNALYNSAKRTEELENDIHPKIKLEIDEKPNISELPPQVEVQFTSEESDLVDTLYNTLAACTSTLVRDELVQAVIDHGRGAISQAQLLTVLARGKSRQTQLHVTVMSNLPFFSDLSKR